MVETVVIQNEYATLEFHPKTKIVHHTFHQPIGGQKFREVLIAGTDLLKKYGASKWLSDDRENSALSPEDSEWAMKEWFPNAKSAGWKYWGLVVPPDILARMNLKQFVDDYYEQGLRIMVFTKPEEARAWLEAQ
jgi:hypothetical protein